MTNSREFILKHTRLLDTRDVPYEVDRRGNHIKLRMKLHGSWRLLVLPSTPSCSRSLSNSLAQLRRMLRAAPAAKTAALLPESIYGFAA